MAPRGWTRLVLGGASGLTAGVLVGFVAGTLVAETAPASSPATATAEPELAKALNGQQAILDALRNLAGSSVAVAVPEEPSAIATKESSFAELESQAQALSSELQAFLSELKSADLPLPVRAVESRPAGLDRVSLAMLRTLSKEDLTAAMQWRTYADVVKSLGRPAIVRDGWGNNTGFIEWLYDPDGDWLFVQFVDGYVVKVDSNHLHAASNK